jgi:hypothetical protein
MSSMKSPIVRIPYHYPVLALQKGKRKDTDRAYMTDHFLVRLLDVSAVTNPVAIEFQFMEHRNSFLRPDGSLAIDQKSSGIPADPVRYRRIGDKLYRPVLFDYDLELRRQEHVLSKQVVDMGGDAFRRSCETGTIAADDVDAMMEFTERLGVWGRVGAVVPFIRENNGIISEQVRDCYNANNREVFPRVVSDLKERFRVIAEQSARKYCLIDGILHRETSGPTYSIDYDDYKKSVFISWRLDYDAVDVHRCDVPLETAWEIWSVWYRNRYKDQPMPPVPEFRAPRIMGDLPGDPTTISLKSRWVEFQGLELRHLGREGVLAVANLLARMNDDNLDCSQIHADLTTLREDLETREAYLPYLGLHEEGFQRMKNWLSWRAYEVNDLLGACEVFLKTHEMTPGPR